MSSFVFVDSRVQDYESLIERLDPGVQVVILDPAQDGVTQIAAALAGVTDLDAVHILSHGSQGTLYLGSTVLTEGNLDDFATELAQIGASLSEEGDLLLYGCNVGAGEAGESFITSLADYTGADVAASTDATGSAALEGDWVLEESSGTIESVSVVTSAAQETYAFTLDISGTTGDDSLVGTAGAESIFGDAGNDTLDGAAGDDTLDGGADDDVLIYDAADVTSVTGGSGTDTLRITGSAVALNLTGGAGTVYTDIEVIDLSGSGDNTLTLSASDALAISSTNTLRIDGNAGDVVDAGTGWTFTGHTVIGAQTYAVYTNGGATLQADTSVDRSALPGMAVELSALDGVTGFRLLGVAAGDGAGFSISAAGDVNGDGFDDVIVGAHDADPNGASSGASYVVFGKASGFASSINLSTLNGASGFRLTGAAAADYSGYSVSDAGDVNGDGFDDLVVGAWGAVTAGSFAGASYVVFGKASGFAASINLSTLNGANGFRLAGVAGEDHTGRSVSAAGDVNGDGFDDLIVGAPHAESNGYYNYGASYVVFGKDSGFASTIDLNSPDSLDGTNGFGIAGVAPDDWSGFSVSAAGDVNGDGFGDVIIGAYFADINANAAGASYVVFGAAAGFAPSLDLSALNGTNGFRLGGVASADFSGYSVGAAGDVNGDGFADLIVGAPNADANDSNSGASYVVFGKASGFAANLNLSALDGTNGFRLAGVAAEDHSGRSVSAAGDVNGDGFDDLIIGAPGAFSNTGASYVVFGGDFTGAVTLLGTSDADDIAGDAGAENVIAGRGNDTFAGSAGNDYLSGGAGRDLLDFSAAGALVTVNLRSGRAAGAATDDDRLNGIEDVTGSALGDSLTGSLGANTLSGGDGDDSIIGGGGHDLLEGGAGNDTLRGGAGNDTLDGGPGDDLMAGGVGDDTYFVDSALDVVEPDSQGTDTVFTTASIAVFAAVEVHTYMGAQGGTVTGNTDGNILTIGVSNGATLVGAGGNDTLAGGGGNDTLDGGTEVDTVSYAHTNGAMEIDLKVGLATGNGTDILLGFENAIGGSGADKLIGNDLANVLNGNAGPDTMEGGGGNDTYLVDNAHDQVVETTNSAGALLAGSARFAAVLDGFIDTVVASIDYSLSGVAFVENVTLASTATTGTGNELDNVMTGNDLANRLAGLAGNDTLDGGTGNDTLDGGTGNDSMSGGTGNDTYVVNAAGDVVSETATGGTDLIQSTVAIASLAANVEKLTFTGSANLNGTGNALANTLTGNAGANVLDGGAGNDTLTGGAGNDTYVVNATGDVVNDASGVDLVQSSVSYTLGSALEHLTLVGSAVIDGTGNAAANVMTGNSSGNRLVGAGGNDTLTGGEGSDTLEGGTGDDTYVVEASSDTVTEGASGGIDLIQSAVAVPLLAANVEKLTLTGTADLNATGNTLANTLTGNAGANVLAGLGGNDSIMGGGAADRLAGAGGKDTLSGGSGADQLAGGAGNDTMAGGGAADQLTGGGGKDALNGGGGADRLDGDQGRDTLTGGLGKDRFEFDTALSVLTNVDRITDFRPVDDTIELDRTIFSKLATGNLAAGAFYQGAAAHDTSDRIVYNQATGNLYYDADGSGSNASAILFATLAGTPTLTAADFFIVA